LRDAFDLQAWRSWLAWGGAVGSAIALTGIVGKLARSAPLRPGPLGWATANTLLIAPLFEEFLLRAAVLGNLTPAWGSARANLVSACCCICQVGL
jgi:membrane protease YdiL (CAAX protease family)